MPLDISNSDYIALVRQPIHGNGYESLPCALISTERLLSEKNEERAHEFNKALLKSLLEDFSTTGSKWVLTTSHFTLYAEQIARLQNQLATKPDKFFSLDNDVFRKELSLLIHRFIPFGAEFATPYAGVVRSLALQSNPFKSLTFIRSILESGGMKPFLELHMHPEVKDQFTPQGWIETYELLADFLELNPGFRGVYSTSWFLDPALASISPHLTYLRSIPERCGAHFFYAGTDNHGHSGALETSHTRRGLYAAGQYRPKLYARIWPRKQILRRKWREFA